MKTFSIKSLLWVTLFFAVLFICLFTPFRFEYPLLVNSVQADSDKLVLWVDAGNGMIQGAEVTEYQLSDSKTHVVKRLTLAELVLFEWQQPVFELNPDEPTY